MEVNIKLRDTPRIVKLKAFLLESNRIEDLHPFTDGNGRSGRLLWYWYMNEEAPLGFLHHWHYQTLAYERNT